MDEALLAIVLELGGRAGARLAAELGLLVGRDALLSRAKRAAPTEAGQVKVLGIDDFAFRRGARYGTILVDLERRRVVDLLPERSQESLLAWLRRHPEVETATRDRSLYREIRERGYENSEETCARFIAQIRPAEAKRKPPSSVPRARRGFVAGLSPTSKNVAALFSCAGRRSSPRSRRSTWGGCARLTKPSPTPAA